VGYNDPKNEDNYGVVWDTLNIHMLEPHVYSVSEYSNQMKNNSWLVAEVKKNGV
jgi:hypothetical protein